VTGFLVIVGLLVLAVALWVAVISIRFLRSGRKAFDRYLFVTSDPIRPVPHAPTAPSENLREGSDYTRKNYGT
jgi:hypothetical protein